MKAFDRRKFLRGVGGCLALPALEYFAPAGAMAQSSARRILYCYMPNGAFWQATGVGTGFELPEVLSPLSQLKEYITVISGLTLPSARDTRGGDHARAAGAFLTGVLPEFPGPGVVRSIDYDLADVIGGGTRYATLTLAGENESGSDSGYAEAYQGNFSWASASAPSTKETNPQAVFERLFGGANTPPAGGFGGSSPSVSSKAKAKPRAASDKSVLDYVKAEAEALSGRLGSADRQKIDEYLTSVRELEKRVYPEAEEDGPEPAGQCMAPTRIGPADTYQQRIGLLYELMFHAFACDLTRVGTFMVANEASNIGYDFAGVSRGHHDVSHDDTERGRQDLAGIIKWHIGQLAAFLAKLKAANMLDDTLVLFGAGLGDGARHDHDNLAILVAGRAGGLVPGGRHIEGKDAPLSNLHLTLAQALGANWSKFGESTAALGLA
jgi:hypothetical protein